MKQYLSLKTRISLFIFYPLPPPPLFPSIPYCVAHLHCKLNKARCSGTRGLYLSPCPSPSPSLSLLLQASFRTVDNTCHPIPIRQHTGGRLRTVDGLVTRRVETSFPRYRLCRPPGPQPPTVPRYLIGRSQEEARREPWSTACRCLFVIPPQQSTSSSSRPRLVRSLLRVQPTSLRQPVSKKSRAGW